MEEVFKRDYQVHYIQCMPNKPYEYIGDNVWIKQLQALLCILKELYTKETKM